MSSLVRLFYICIISISATACGGSKFMLDRGKESFQEQNYRQAFIRLEPVANAGNADAQYALAYMYYYGQGVIEDRKIALSWMEKSAAQGQTNALQGLEMMKNSAPSPYAPSKNPKLRAW